jgi:hypothetical protein
LAKLTIGAEKGSSTMLVLVHRRCSYFADLMHLPLHQPTLDKTPEEGLHERSKPTSQEENGGPQRKLKNWIWNTRAQSKNVFRKMMKHLLCLEPPRLICHNWTTVYSLVVECGTDCPNTRSVSRHRRGPKGGGTPVNIVRNAW